MVPVYISGVLGVAQLGVAQLGQYELNGTSSSSSRVIHITWAGGFQEMTGGFNG